MELVREEADQEHLAPGCRFNPTDDVLLFEYLCPRVLGLPLPTNAVLEYNVYSTEPWFLPTVASSITGGTNAQYYFTRRNKHSIKRINRVVTDPKGEGGWWSESGGNPVCNKEGYVMGSKNSFAFHSYKDGKPRSSKNGEATKWLMHEYVLPTYNYDEGSKQGEEIVLCRIRDSTKDKGCHYQ